jgi:hypothetical protein
LDVATTPRVDPWKKIASSRWSPSGEPPSGPFSPKPRTSSARPKPPPPAKAMRAIGRTLPAGAGARAGGAARNARNGSAVFNGNGWFPESGHFRKAPRRSFPGPSIRGVPLAHAGDSGADRHPPRQGYRSGRQAASAHRGLAGGHRHDPGYPRRAARPRRAAPRIRRRLPAQRNRGPRFGGSARDRRRSHRFAAAVKTDQEGQGREVAVPFGSTPATCPVRAVRTWLEDLNDGSGPLFRPINRHGQLLAGRLTDRSVALIVKRRAGQAGLETASLAGHSLRSGLATAAAKAGL